VQASSETGYYGGGPGMQEAKSRWDEAASFGSGYSSPGWRRAQERTAAYVPPAGVSRGFGASRSPVIEGEGRLVAASAPESASAFQRGDRVFHQKFGYGAVRSVDGNKLTVAFDKAGEKKVIDSFVQRG
jgi:DNA helicase-2/ATP-dependent DNA helicase PcrA